MQPETTQPVAARPCRPLMPLFFSLAGWGLLHTWLFLVGANYRAHISVAVLGCILAARPVWHCLNARRAIPGQAGDSPSVSRRSSVLTALLLPAIGAVLSSLAVNGSVVLLSIAAAALTFLPWPRPAFDQRHPVVSCALITSGFAPVLWIRFESIDVMFLPLAVWAFWLCAYMGLILMAEQSRRATPGLAALKGAK